MCDYWVFLSLLSSVLPSGSVWQWDAWSRWCNTWRGDVWRDDTWGGDTWEGDTWECDTWEGDTWEGDTWEGDTWEGNAWASDTSKGDIREGNTRKGDTCCRARSPFTNLLLKVGARDGNRQIHWQPGGTTGASTDEGHLLRPWNEFSLHLQIICMICPHHWLDNYTFGTLPEYVWYAARIYCWHTARWDLRNYKWMHLAW